MEFYQFTQITLLCRKICQNRLSRAIASMLGIFIRLYPVFVKGSENFYTIVFSCKTAKIPCIAPAMKNRVHRVLRSILSQKRAGRPSMRLLRHRRNVAAKFGIVFFTYFLIRYPQSQITPFIF